MMRTASLSHDYNRVLILGFGVPRTHLAKEAAALNWDNTWALGLRSMVTVPFRWELF